ncbi:carboxylesterase/lipase family protein [Nocardioides cheoyonin]|uniref:carboxylesterase/lipase family protein n=1 Tax=Nocardioides cheoyonin TaxID=3156615 RepID=UPI0032B51A52
MPARTRRTAVVVAALGLVLAALVTSPPAVDAHPSGGGGHGPGRSSLDVRTDTGVVRGFRDQGVDTFRGIPYAAPPVGALRWQPPQPHARWRGVLETTSYGPRCAALESTNGPRTEAEDCLYLNVDRPTGARPGERLPVYVFIHGGGLVNGSSNQASGEKIAREAHVIVVSMNYRLGVFGFLGLSGLSGQGSGDYGFLDQQAALRWVRSNVAAFGGDPGNVTVGGESAGGFSVCGHLTSPGSRGLFNRAMIQSGSCLSRPVAETETDSTSFAAAAGCSDPATAVTCLRGKDTATLLDASSGFSPTLTSGTAALPEPPTDAVAAGRFTRVPVVNGSNRDEGRTFAQGYIGADEAAYDDFVRSSYPDDADAVLAHYPWPATADRFTAAYLVGAIMTDSGMLAGIGGCGALSLTEQLARWVPVHAYEFDARNGPGLTPIEGYVWGAGHAAELAYLFPSFDNGTPIAPTFDAGERQLSRDMVQYWGSFVARGTPYAPGRAFWPVWNGSGQVMSLRVAGQSHTISTAAYRAEHQCDFWDSVG